MWKQLIENKFHLQQETLAHTISQWKFFNEKIVFTNGCFDILHIGHISYLMQAKELGTKLIIGLNGDESVQKLKGPNRPVNNQHSRGLLLASLGFVDAVILFHEETPEQLIQWVKPDFLVKGKDYENKKIAGADFVNSYGGKVVLMDIIENFSTSSIIRKIQSNK